MLYETVVIVALGLLALLVGVAIPALLQLRRTLESAQSFFDSTGRRAQSVLGEVSEATGRINRIAETVETEGRRLAEAFESVRSLAHAIAALGPAAAAAASALVQVLVGDGREDSVSTQTPPRTEPTTAGKEVGSR